MKNMKIIMFVSICSFFVMSLSFTLMYFIKSAVICGFLIWIPFILGIVTQLIMRSSVSKDRRVGLFSIFSNRYAIFADAVFLISLIAFILSLILSNVPGAMITYILLSVVVFSFCMHCILNGRIFNSILNEK